MEILILDFFVRYLILPILCIILAGAMLYFAHRGKLLEKRVVVYLGLSVLVGSLLGLLGIMNLYFMPYTYLFLAFLFLLIGLSDYCFLSRSKAELKESLWKQLLLILPQILLSWAFFSLLFNLTNSFQYGVYSGGVVLSVLVVPCFMSAYRSYLQIPVEIYKMREYQESDMVSVPFQSFGTGEILVCEIELCRNLADNDTIRIKAKAKSDMMLGDWFALILSDYNSQATDRPIELNNPHEKYGWIFYDKPSFFRTRRYMDPDASFRDNHLEEKNLIVAKRVKI